MGPVEHPDEPHKHCPVCLVPIIGDEATIGRAATIHFEEEHPDVAAQIREEAKEMVKRMKAPNN